MESEKLENPSQKAVGEQKGKTVAEAIPSIYREKASLRAVLFTVFMLIVIIASTLFIGYMIVAVGVALGVSIIEVLIFLSFALVIDASRSIGKAIVLPMQRLYYQLRPRTFNPNYLPTVSIILPAHNEEAIIARSIETLLEVDYPSKEIIVVDDGSTDRTCEIAEIYEKREQIKLIRRPMGYGKKTYAINYGIFWAHGEIIVTMDADTLIERDAIRQLVKYFEDPKVVGMAGNVRVFNKPNFLSKLQAYEYLTAFEMGRRFQAFSRTLLILPGSLTATRAAYLRSLGSFDADTFTEDFDVALKLHKVRGRVGFAPDAVAWTFVPETWHAWVRQRVRWARGQIQEVVKHRNLVNRIFGVAGVLGMPDMIAMDIVALFARIFGLFFILLFFPWAWQHLLIMYAALYFYLELIIMAAAGTVSRRRVDLKEAIYAPAAVLFYRPFYAFVRMRGYLEELFGIKGRW